MWIVVPGYDKRGNPCYFVENKETHERRGIHDCLKWAETYAEYLNKEEQNGKG